jgi:hypothetical protein
MFIYDAAMKYMAAGVPTVIFAGEEYGTGSSRDWAAKGTQLLGIKAVVARSFERIHRSNLVGMGVLPLQFKAGESWETLGLKGDETVDVIPAADLRPQSDATLVITRADGQRREVTVTLRIDTPIEVDYYRHGGILPFVLRQLAGGGALARVVLDQLALRRVGLDGLAGQHVLLHGHADVHRERCPEQHRPQHRGHIQLARRQLAGNRHQQGVGGAVAQRRFGQRLEQREQAIVRIGVQQRCGPFLDAFQPIQRALCRLALDEYAAQHGLQVQPATGDVVTYDIVHIQNRVGHGGPGYLLNAHVLSQHVVHHSVIAANPRPVVALGQAGLVGHQHLTMLLGIDGLALAQQQIAFGVPHWYRQRFAGFNALDGKRNVFHFAGERILDGV